MELCVSLALERCANPQMVADPCFSGNSSQDLSGRKTQPLSRGESGSKTWCVANFDTPDCCHVRPKPGRRFFFGGGGTGEPSKNPLDYHGLSSVSQMKSAMTWGTPMSTPIFIRQKSNFPVRLSMHWSLKMFKTPVLNETDID